MKYISIQLLIPLLAVSLCCGADWPQFRGPLTNNVSLADAPPGKVDQGSIAWTADLEGRGASGPIVVGDKVFLTSTTGFKQDQLHVLCFDLKSGKQLWDRQFWATGRTQCHNKMCVATPTPASDGQRVFATFSSNDVVCLDLDGNLLWVRGLSHDYPNASNSLGMASSPIVVGETLIVPVENDDDSFTTGLDVKTGIARWKIQRPRVANWTSPAILKASPEAEPLVLLQSSEGVDAIYPQTGETAWQYEDGAGRIPSTTVGENTLFVPSNGLTALTPGSSSEPPKVLWSEQKLSPATASPLVYQKKVFTVNRAGVLTCASPQTGEVIWRLRLKGPFSATPIAAANHLYLISEKGLLQVVQLGEEQGEVTGEVDLKETILATPAIADDSLFLRSDQHLWKISSR
ncbi:PQQ-binding-like beta-propeller repeat protein [Gimesia sp.]|uniref:outer membrane protein assembly factor BamB family protein n=1 Tax=Gimesia sp. TaxID=2024833 RepID=UPI000C3BB1E4|nr:PQQ-binding-like beta-propeller repeat protein [Gimesia sp.]MAX37705.1 pyrrolo-quinoline quinone [Gimesia sp.]HAH43343.1 pyrrolo-quinoline quinone [Planctomycetaceae bacterium]|tara:strand:+ start:8355 stop:9563 length:1209 start_codon:yes stop_codon:yes gene_type:complete